MTIEWNDKLSVGNETIDDDHKHLIKLINAYELAVSQKNIKILRYAFGSLADYALAHFEREEKIMDAIHYPNRRPHREVHKRLLETVKKKHEEIVQATHLNIDDLSAFLRSWLIDHVIKEDMQIKSYLMGGRANEPRIT